MVTVARQKLWIVAVLFVFSLGTEAASRRQFEKDIAVWDVEALQYYQQVGRAMASGIEIETDPTKKPRASNEEETNNKDSANEDADAKKKISRQRGKKDMEIENTEEDDARKPSTQQRRGTSIEDSEDDTTKKPKLEKNEDTNTSEDFINFFDSFRSVCNDDLLNFCRLSGHRQTALESCLDRYERVLTSMNCRLLVGAKKKCYADLKEAHACGKSKKDLSLECLALHLNAVWLSSECSDSNLVKDMKKQLIKRNQAK